MSAAEAGSSSASFSVAGPDHRKSHARAQGGFIADADESCAPRPHDQSVGRKTIFCAFRIVDQPDLSGYGESALAQASRAPLPCGTQSPRKLGARNFQARCNQNPACGVEQAKQPKNDEKGLTMLISTLALAMSIAMMVSAIVILYNETANRKQRPSFE